MSIFFLFRNHCSNSDFIFLFSHHNSIYDAGLTISRCLKAFPATLNTIQKNLFLLYDTVYINIYSTVFFRWCEVDGWGIRYDHRDVNHLQINSWSCAVAIVWNTVERVFTFKKGSDGELTVNYFKDVSLLLPLVSAVRECNIAQNL